MPKEYRIDNYLKDVAKKLSLYDPSHERDAEDRAPAAPLQSVDR